MSMVWTKNEPRLWIDLVNYSIMAKGFGVMGA